MKRGTRNHSLGLNSLPNRSLISTSNLAAPKNCWISYSNWIRYSSL